MNAQRVSPIYTFLVGAAGAVIVLAGMKAAASIVVSIILAALLAIALSPLQSRMVRRGWPGWLALIITILVGVLILVALIGILAISLAQLAQALPGYSDEIEALTGDLAQTAEALNIDADTVMTELEANADNIVQYAAALVAGLLGALSDAALVIAIIAFMLFEALELPRKVEVVRPLMGEKMVGRFTRSINHMREYLVLTAGVGAAAGALDAVFLTIIGVDFAILWGVLSFLLSFIPSVGFILALIPPTILALLEFGWPTALVVIAGYLIINGLFDNVVKPKYMGEGLNLSAVLVFLSLIFWGFILGPLGAILAIPLTVLVKELIIESDEKWSWIGVLMGTAGGAEEQAESLESAEDT